MRRLTLGSMSPVGLIAAGLACCSSADHHPGG
jgi:hypothetical protein